jgi:hypothetical protein
MRKDEDKNKSSIALSALDMQLSRIVRSPFSIMFNEQSGQKCLLFNL